MITFSFLLSSFQLLRDPDNARSLGKQYAKGASRRSLRTAPGSHLQLRHGRGVGHGGPLKVFVLVVGPLISPANLFV
jgi:hypothetical protein